MKNKLYLAHPMSGLSGKEIFDYFDTAKDKLNKYYDILSPVTGKDYLRTIDKAIPSGYKNPISNDHAIFQRDTWMVSQSNIVFCDFTGSEKISIGCCMELAIASWLNKHTIVVMDKNNVHKHSFILEAADIIFDTLEEGLNYLIELGND
jgi:hypothetical protein